MIKLHAPKEDGREAEAALHSGGDIVTALKLAFFGGIAVGVVFGLALALGPSPIGSWLRGEW